MLDLSTLGLSADAIAERRHFIGGSDANTIMGGNEDRIIRLWQEKRGEIEPEDLSGNLAVQMGSFTEALNAAWFEKQTGRRVIFPHQMADGGLLLIDKRPLPFMSCTLDGWLSDGDGLQEAVWEAKHTNERSTAEELWERYLPQIAHNCLCTGAPTAVLSIFRGNRDWLTLEYERNGDYEAALIEAERAFWACVQSGEPPCPLPPPPAPKPKGVREYCMDGSNAWAVSASLYIETLAQAEQHEAAKKDLKELTPADASKAFGHGVELRRDKRGALRIYQTGETR